MRAPLPLAWSRRVDNAPGGLSAVPVFAAGALIVVWAAVFIALAAASPSQALGAKSFSGFVGGLNATVFSPSGPGGTFNQSRDVVVFEGTDGDPATDKIFVVDAQASTQRVQRLDSEGSFERAWGKDVVRSGRPGDTGSGYEICTVSADCQMPSTGIGGAGGEFDDPQGIAVSQATGHVYVRDRDNRRVQEFDFDGHFVRAWGWGVDDGTAALQICTTGCQAGLAGAGDGQFGTSSTAGSGIAVHPGPGPDAGHVFVADPANRRVQEFDANGAFVAKFGSAGSGLGQFGSNQPLRIAVDSGGVVYASDTSSGGRINRYDSATDAFLAPIAAPPLLAGGSTADSTSGLEVDPDTGNLYVLRNPSSGDTVIQELAAPGAIVPPAAVADTHTAGTPLTTTVNGLGYSPGSDTFYVAVSAAGAQFPACDPTALLSCAGLIAVSDSGPGGTPVVEVAPPSDVDADSATVNATIDANDGVAGYHFEYSPDGVTWTSSGVDRYVSGSDPRQVSAQIDGLRANTQYRVRVIATKYLSLQTRQVVTSGEGSFLTDAIAPSAVTLGATQRQASSATLQGTVNPNGSPTTYRFEYGTTIGYGRSAPVPDASAGAGGAPVSLSQPVTGLEPDTLYHYRLVAENAVGVTPGADVTFRTRALPVSPVGDRAYELVSPADKLSGIGVGAWYTNPASLIGSVGTGAYVGERFISMGNQGNMLVDGAFGFATDAALGERTPAGWVHRPASTRGGYGPQDTRFLSLYGANEDLSLMGWDSNGGILRLFPEQEDWEDQPVFSLRDWDSGKWEVFGPTDPETQNQPNDGFYLSNAMSLDGRLAVAAASVYGLAGSGDPTSLHFGDFVLGGTPPRNVYADDVSAGLSDTFPGAGVRSLVSSCTGVGAARTLLPLREADGKQGAQPCALPAGGRDETMISRFGAALAPKEASSLQGSVSADSRRIFFVSPDMDYSGVPASCTGTGGSTSCPPQVYVRQRMPDGSFAVRWISRPEVAGQDASLLASAVFLGASVDGDKAFFKTASPLTADDPNGAVQVPGGVTTGAWSGGSVDLYMYDFPDVEGTDPGDGTLTRISAGPTGASDGNVGLMDSGSPLRLLSSDGDRAYFTSTAPLDGVSGTANGALGGPGESSTETNLYLYDAGQPPAQRWRFVTRLPRGGGGSAGGINGCAATNMRPGGLFQGGIQDPTLSVSTVTSCVRGTSDGGLVMFTTAGRLTADDPAGGAADIYAYDADRDELVRVSAPQGGAGGSYLCQELDAAEGVTTEIYCNADPGIPGSPLVPLGVVTDPEVEGDRVMFFESKSPLVAGDSDAAWDVYQWRNGELSLITPGDTETDGHLYIGNDRTGKNVYFVTRDQLSWQDHDAVTDIYSARVGGGIPQPAAPIVCAVLGDGCQAAGDAGPVSRVESAEPADGNAVAGARVSLSVSALSAKARRRAARTGVLSIAVRADGAGLVEATAKARIARRTRTVAKGSRALARPGRVVLRLRLSRASRRALAGRRGLRVAVRVQMAGAKGRAITVRLPGASR